MPPSNGEKVTINVMDYSADGVHTDAWPVPDECLHFFHNRPEEVRFEPRNKEANKGFKGVRWVHMRGLNKSKLLKLAVKYRLHPLAVEDALDMQLQPAKVDSYERHFFIAANILQLDEDTLNGYVNLDDPNTELAVPPRVKIHCSYVCMFVAGAPCHDTLISIYQMKPIAGRRSFKDLNRGKLQRDERNVRNILTPKPVEVQKDGNAAKQREGEPTQHVATNHSTMFNRTVDFDKTVHKDSSQA